MVFEPKELAEIDTVDIANLEGVNADRVSEFMQNADDAVQVPIADELGNGLPIYGGSYRLVNKPVATFHRLVCVSIAVESFNFKLLFVGV